MHIRRQKLLANCVLCDEEIVKDDKSTMVLDAQNQIRVAWHDECLEFAKALMKWLKRHVETQK